MRVLHRFMLGYLLEKKTWGNWRKDTLKTDEQVYMKLILNDGQKEKIVELQKLRRRLKIRKCQAFTRRLTMEWWNYWSRCWREHAMKKQSDSEMLLRRKKKHLDNKIAKLSSLQNICFEIRRRIWTGIEDYAATWWLCNSAQVNTMLDSKITIFIRPGLSTK